VAEVLPLLYLHGLSTSDFAPALEQFLGSDAGLSAATINRLTTQWQGEAAAFNQRSLAGTDYVYMWVDGIHLKVRLEQDKVCLLVMIGVRSDGRKELIALADGFRESTESWADLLRSAKRRGMTAPVLAVGDGALGFWAAVREVCLGLGVQWSGMDSRTRLRIALVDDAQRHPGRVAPQRLGQDRPGRVSSRAPAPGRSPLVAVGHGTDRGERRGPSRYVVSTPRLRESWSSPATRTARVGPSTTSSHRQRRQRPDHLLTPRRPPVLLNPTRPVGRGREDRHELEGEWAPP
jgi:hypothetical protein